MSNTDRHEDIRNHHNGQAIRAIDPRHVMAPQYGVSKTPPKFNPPNPLRGKRNKKRNAKRRALALVRRQRTKDLKICIAILEAELALANSGSLQLRQDIL